MDSAKRILDTGDGIVLNDQPDVIDSWKMLKEWPWQNIPMNTGLQNLRIITGLGDSMRGMFEPGDPLIVDTGIRGISQNKEYPSYILKEDKIRGNIIVGYAIRGNNCVSGDPEKNEKNYFYE